MIRKLFCWHITWAEAHVLFYWQFWVKYFRFYLQLLYGSYAAWLVRLHWVYQGGAENSFPCLSQFKFWITSEVAESRSTSSTTKHCKCRCLFLESDFVQESQDKVNSYCEGKKICYCKEKQMGVDQMKAVGQFSRGCSKFLHTVNWGGLSGHKCFNWKIYSKNVKKNILK